MKSEWKAKRQTVGEIKPGSPARGWCDNITVEIQENKGNFVLITSLWKDNYFGDSFDVKFTIDEDGAHSDTEYWMYRCLELAAELDKERAKKRDISR